jgi:lipoprotein signal peptidase
MNGICNSSSAWDLVEDQMALKFGSLLLLLIILYLVYNAKTKMKRLGWVLVLSGGSANAWERFQYGCVTDYLKPLSWYPAFNLADALIVVGVAILLFEYLKKDSRKLAN